MKWFVESAYDSLVMFIWKVQKSRKNVEELKGRKKSQQNTSDNVSAAKWKKLLKNATSTIISQTANPMDKLWEQITKKNMMVNSIKSGQVI